MRRGKRSHVPGASEANPSRAGRNGFVLPFGRTVLAGFLVLAVALAAGFFGYRMGREDRPVAAADAGIETGIVAFDAKLNENERVIQEIEKLNLEQALQDEIDRAEVLQDAVDNTEKTILDALMTNLEEKLVTSRSSRTAKNYIAEAKNLIALRTKFNKFKKTDAYGTVDLSSYEEAVQSRLSRIPTLKPTSGKLEGYGWRIHPIYRYKHFHPAVDMGASRGTAIKAAGAGTIIEKGYNRRSGNYLVIDHGNGFTTTYMHCQKLLVNQWQKVKKGEKIATVGNTGTSTAPHLHFEVRFRGEPINPVSIILEW